MKAKQINISEIPYSYLKHFRGIYTIINSDNTETPREFEIIYEVNTEDLRKRVNFYPRGNKFSQIEQEEILIQFNLQINGPDTSNTGESDINEG